jgi:hypothetical protein
MLWRSATSTVTDRYFRELHSMRFRQPQDYVLLLIVMAAFFALGRNRSRDVVIISLLAVSAVISFRLQRDSWFVVMVSVAILGSELRESQSSEEPSVAHLKGTALALALIIVVVVAGVATLPSNAVLSTQVAERYPLRACDYIRQNHLPQPLFNAYDWGAFATWCLPEDAVYIDSRTELYGDGFSVLYFKLMQAEIPIQSHPGFAQAQTFLLEANAPLAEALATLPGFHVSYRDSIATVIVRD